MDAWQTIGNHMNEQPNANLLHALKTAFCYMPKAIEVNKYDHGDRVDGILADIQRVRETLLANGVDPDEVYGEMNPEEGGRSYY
jgi:hypothetical protein